MVVLLPSPDHLDTLAQERIDDARALLAAGRFAGAHYMCGYAMEMKLKSRICKVHEWTEYPPKSGERLAQALRTHNIEELLLFTGLRTTMLEQYGVDWFVVAVWSPEQRYRPAAFTQEEAQRMVAASDALMVIL
jgi:hypothetical protein